MGGTAAAARFPAGGAAGRAAARAAGRQRGARGVGRRRLRGGGARKGLGRRLTRSRAAARGVPPVEAQGGHGTGRRDAQGAEAASGRERGGGGSNPAARWRCGNSDAEFGGEKGRGRRGAHRDAHHGLNRAEVDRSTEIDGEAELRREQQWRTRRSASIPAGEQRNRARGGAEEVEGEVVRLGAQRIEARRRGWPAWTPTGH